MRSILLAAAFVVLWSSGFVGARLTADVAAVSGMLAWRYLVTALLLLALVAGRRRRLPPLRDVARQAVIGVLAHVLFLGGVFGGVGAGVDAGTTALVCALQPMLVAAAGRLWWRDRLPGRQVTGLGLGISAVGLSVGGVGGLGVAGVLPVVSVLGLSGAALLERRWQPGVDVAISLAIQVAVAAMCFTAYAVAAGTLDDITPGADFLVALAWLVVLSGLGGYATFVLCLRRLGASPTSTLLYLTPPVTTLWAWVMFGHVPSALQAGGLGLGALAVALVVWPRRATVGAGRTAGDRPAGTSRG